VFIGGGTRLVHFEETTTWLFIYRNDVPWRMQSWSEFKGARCPTFSYFDKVSKSESVKYEVRAFCFRKGRAMYTDLWVVPFSLASDNEVIHQPLTLSDLELSAKLDNVQIPYEILEDFK
jgi:hypothetical protein